MLNGRTYIGILPGQQRQSATDLCVDELSRTYTSGLHHPIPYCLMATSLAWKLSVRNSMNFETVGCVASPPLALRLAAKLRDFLPRRNSNCHAVLLQKSAAFNVLSHREQSVDGINGWSYCLEKCRYIK